MSVRYKLVPVASLLPFRVLRFIGRRWTPGYDPADGWHFWLDADYAKYVRRDKRRNPDLYMPADEERRILTTPGVSEAIEQASEDFKRWANTLKDNDQHG